MASSTGFVLNGGNLEFNDRHEKLFNQLCNAEKSLNKNNNINNSNTEIVGNYKYNASNIPPIKGEFKRFRNQESIFIKPTTFIPRNRFRSANSIIPDYHRNPSKWTKYSLEDSPEITHTSNSQAAFTFLNELRNRKKVKIVDEKMDIEVEYNKELSSSKRNKETDIIMFKKKPQMTDNLTMIDQKEEKAFFRNSKMIMPECVVGVKPTKFKQKQFKKNVNLCNNNSVKLSHLDDNIDDN